MSGIDCLLDTNVVIGILKGHDAAVALAAGAGLEAGQVAVSQITRMELLGFPGLTAQEEDGVRRLLSLWQVLPITDAVESRAIAPRRSGKLRLPDAIIAATAAGHFKQPVCMDARHRPRPRRSAPPRWA